MPDHFNNLTPGELERLAILAEECAEVIQIVNKIIRHGKTPTKNGVQYDNYKDLAEEIGHIDHIATMMIDSKDLIKEDIIISECKKRKDIKQYLHHQE